MCDSLWPLLRMEKTSLLQMKKMGVNNVPPQEAVMVKLQTWLLHYMTFITPLAAYNFHRAGKGTLFVTKIAMEDLFDLSETGRPWRQFTTGASWRVPSIGSS